MAFRIPVIWRDSIPPHETITYTEPLPSIIRNKPSGRCLRVITDTVYSKITAFYGIKYSTISLGRAKKSAEFPL